MKVILSIVISVIFSCAVFSQSFSEKILNTTNSNTCNGALELEGFMFFNYSSSDYYKGYSRTSLLYKSDLHLNIVDSISLTRFGGYDIFHVLNMVSTTDSSFIVLGQAIQDTPYKQLFYALEFDSNLDLIGQVEVDKGNDTTFGGISYCRVNHSQVFGGYWYVGTSSAKPGFVVINDNGNVSHEVILDSIPFGVLNSLTVKDSSVLAGFRPGFLTWLTIDTTSFDVLQMDFFGGGVSIGGFFEFSAIDTQIYAYGEMNSHYLGLWKVESDLNLSLIDTFASVSNPTSQERATIADAGIVTVGSEDEIYFATTEGAYYIPAQLNAGIYSHLKLWRVDTGGNVIWSHTVADSSYYLPTKTVAISDGGAVFFSMKYDWRKDPSPKTALSIIKLDSNGNFIALHEKEVGYSKPLEFSVYPNPVVNELTLSGVELRDVAAVLVYSMDGVLIEEEVNPQSLTISLADFPSGTYVVHVLHKNGSQGMQKVTKL